VVFVGVAQEKAQAFQGKKIDGSDVEQLRRMREAYDRHEIGRW
jgi:hypothetical protein